MRSSHKQIGAKYAQFSLVGASNTLVDAGTFNLLLLLWSTYNQARHDARQVGMFTVQGLLNVGVGNALLWLVAHGLEAHTDLSPLLSGNVAKVVSMVVASTLSFLFLRLLVFRPKKA
jgi:putative flippase GtrA